MKEDREKMGYWAVVAIGVVSIDGSRLAPGQWSSPTCLIYRAFP